MNQDTLVTVFGGSGFLGRGVVRALAKRDYRIRVGVQAAGTRRAFAAARQCRPDPRRAGQYPRTLASIDGAVRNGADRVVNLVGILRRDPGARLSTRWQDIGARYGGRSGRVPQSAQAWYTVRRSAPIANSPVASMRAPRPRGERAGAGNADPDAVIYAAVHRVRARGPFLQPLRRTWRSFSPVLPLIGGGRTRLPAGLCRRRRRGGRPLGRRRRQRRRATYELGGPEVLTMREIMEIILATIERRRMLVPLPFGLAQFQSLLLQFAPGPLKLTPDQVTLLRSDNVVSDAAKAAGLTLEGLGIAATRSKPSRRNTSGASAPPGNSRRVRDFINPSPAKRNARRDP